MGDFNDLLVHAEKKGRVDKPKSIINVFRNIIVGSRLKYLPLTGYPFTWTKSKGIPNEV